MKQPRILVARIMAAPKENIKRFKAKLNRIKGAQRFIRWGESARLARELKALLQDLKAGVDDPGIGAELVVEFYETDKETLGNCDDSTGHVGDVYRIDAKALFVDYAELCADKECEEYGKNGSRISILWNKVLLPRTNPAWY